MAAADTIGQYAEPRRVLELLLDKLNIVIVDCRNDVKLARNHDVLYIDVYSGNRTSNAERLAAGLANLVLRPPDDD